MSDEEYIPIIEYTNSAALVDDVQHVRSSVPAPGTQAVRNTILEVSICGAAKEMWPE